MWMTRSVSIWASHQCVHTIREYCFFVVVVVVWPTTEKKSLWVVGTQAQVLIHQCKDGVQRWRYAAEYAQMLGLREFNSVVIEVNLWAKICASQLLNNRSKYINI